MRDPIWQNKSQNEFQQVIIDALRISSKGIVVGLAASPLAHTSLVEGCFLAGEAMNDHLRGVVTQEVLRWGINQLRPMGTESWRDEPWRQYNVLFYPYIEGMTFEQLAEKMAFSTQAVYKWRSKAVAALTEILWKEVQRGANAQELKNCVIQARYARLTDDEQTLLRMATIFRRPVASSLLHKMAKAADMAHVATSIRHLITLNFLISHNEGRQIEIHADLRAYLLPLLLPQERQAWHRNVAEHEERQEEHLEAAYHFLRTADREGYERAAQTLVENQQAIIDNEQMNELREMLTKFYAHQLCDKSWARIKIAAGDMALLLEDVECALDEYGKALGTSDIESKALAYYRRAKAFHSQNLDEAIAHYNMGINYLEVWGESQALLSDMYIDRAWFYLQERTDLEKAEMDLNSAQALIQWLDSRRRANLHNAWAKLKEQKDDGEELEHRLQGWLAATETQDSDLMIKTAHNLGQAYVWSERYEEGALYLQKALRLSIETGDQPNEAKCCKTMGACYFFQAQYEKAISSYQSAYRIFAEIGEHNWLGHVCHDLAEAYAEIGQHAQAKRYFNEASTIAQRLGGEELLQALEHLARTYPWLTLAEHDLNPHQRNALDFVKQFGRISNKQYRDLTGVAKKTASRHLAELCKKGLLVKKGAGRRTYYTQPDTS